MDTDFQESHNFDRDKVVCARDVEPDKNEELICYLKERRVWTMEVD